MSKWGAQYARKTDAFSDTDFWRRDAGVALNEVKPNTKEPVLIDLGCGTGRMLNFMSRCWRGAKLIGVDINRAGFLLCRDRAPTAELHTSLDAVELGSADAIVVMHAFEQFSDPSDMMIKAWDRLKPEGQLVMVLHNPHFARAMKPKWLLQGYKSDPTITSRMTRRQLAQFMLDHGFKVDGIKYFGGGPLGFLQFLQPRLLLTARRPS